MKTSVPEGSHLLLHFYYFDNTDNHNLHLVQIFLKIVKNNLIHC